jgi:hypothetical protein
MRCAVLLISAAFTLVAAPRAAANAPAHYMPYAQAVPIDQAVGDLDPLSRSLRHMPFGLRSDGEHTSLFALPLSPDAADRPMELYQPTNTLSDGHRFRYYRVGPGFRARVQRLDYLVRRNVKEMARNEAPQRDGQFFEDPGIGAVYDLEPISPLPDHANPALRHTPAAIPEAIPGRMRNQLHNRLDTRLAPLGPVAP